MSTSFLEPILRNLFSEKRGLPLFFSSRTSGPLVKLSCDSDIVLLDAGSDTVCALVGSGKSETALRNFGLQEEALSRFSFSLTTGESDLKFAPGFLANKLELGASSSSAVRSTAGGFGAILLLLGDRIDSAAESWLSKISSSASGHSALSPASAVGSLATVNDVFDFTPVDDLDGDAETSAFGDFDSTP